MSRKQSGTDFLCKCFKCGHVHRRKNRKKIVPEKETKFLCVYVCPKCSAYQYTVIDEI